MNYIKRDIEATILEAARYFPVITVTGPRQSGKTTMLRHAFPIFITIPWKTWTPETLRRKTQCVFCICIQRE